MQIPFFPANILLNPWWFIFVQVALSVPWNSSLSSWQPLGMFFSIRFLSILYCWYNWAFWMRWSFIIWHFEGGSVFWNFCKASVYSCKAQETVMTWHLSSVSVSFSSQKSGYGKVSNPIYNTHTHNYMTFINLVYNYTLGVTPGFSMSSNSWFCISFNLLVKDNFKQCDSAWINELNSNKFFLMQHSKYSWSIAS